jgi:hypothetical protein
MQVTRMHTEPYTNFPLLLGPGPVVGRHAGHESGLP